MNYQLRIDNYEAATKVARSRAVDKPRYLVQAQIYRVGESFRAALMSSMIRLASFGAATFPSKAVTFPVARTSPLLRLVS